jgi:hypothetical protein
MLFVSAKEPMEAQRVDHTTQMPENELLRRYVQTLFSGKIPRFTI